MQIKPLEASRWDEVVALWDVAAGVVPLGERLTAQYLRELSESDRYVAEASVGAYEGGATVGVAWGVIDPNPSFGIDDYRHAPARLEAVAVHPDHRGRGVARELLSRVEIAVRERSHVAIDCTPHGVTVGAPAYRFLGACGYIPVLHKYDIYHDLSQFEFTSDVVERRRRLEGDGVTFRWLEPSD